MSKEGFSIAIEDEPIKESEIVCSFCGPGTFAAWYVVLTDGEDAFLCHTDHTDFEDAELILGERRIGEITWEEVNEIRELLNAANSLNGSTDSADINSNE